MEKETIIKIIRYGTRAASGDNSQPWKFFVSGNSLKLFNIPDRDNPILNFKQSGSHISHGGVIENISIAAGEFGFQANVSLFPDPKDPAFIAKITFEKIEKRKHPLFESIEKRCTNRKPYKKTPLTSEQKTAITSVSEGPVKLTLIEEKQKIKATARLASLLETVALETPAIHKLFFGDMVWSEAEEKKRKSGLYLKTLELPPPVQILFRLVCKWKFVNIFNKIGFSKMAALANADVYSKSSALCLLTVPAHTPENFVKAGRVFQRIWLTAASKNLSLQPVAGLIFLGEKLASGDTEGILPKHHKAIQNSFDGIKSEFETTDHVAMLFRIGDGGEPSARSSRKEPEISFDNQ